MNGTKHWSLKGDMLRNGLGSSKSQSFPSNRLVPNYSQYQTRRLFLNMCYIISIVYLTRQEKKMRWSSLTSMSNSLSHRLTSMSVTVKEKNVPRTVFTYSLQKLVSLSVDSFFCSSHPCHFIHFTIHLLEKLSMFSLVLVYDSALKAMKRAANLSII